MTKLVNKEGLITFNYRPVAYLFNNVLLISPNARDGFGAEDNLAFDKLIYDDLKATSREYVDLSQFFKVAERFKQFQLDSNSLDKYGLTFTDDEKSLMQTYRDYDAKIAKLTADRDSEYAKTSGAIKAKIDAVFKLPEIKYDFGGGVDLVKVFGTAEKAALAAAWRSNPANTTVDGYQIRLRAIESSRDGANLLRQYTTASGNVRIQTLDGQALTLAQARRVWNSVKEGWKTGSYKGRDWGANLNFTISGYYGQVFDQYIKFGCQEVPRAEVERIAQLNGWD